MDTRERMDGDFISAVKARDASAVSTLRMLRAALKNVEIEKMSALTEEDVIEVLTKEVKKVHDSLESFEAAGRTDLAEKARKELELMSRYQPVQLTDDELKSIVRRAVVGLSGEEAANLGRIMSVVMGEVRGRASGAQVSRIVKDELSSTAS